MPRKPRNPKPVKPTNKEATAYTVNILSPLVSDPLQRAFTNVFGQELGVLQSVDFWMDEAQLRLQRTEDAEYERLLVRHFNKYSDEHKEKTARSFHAATRIDIRGFFESEPEVRAAIQDRIGTNVGLIRDLGGRTVTAVAEGVRKAFHEEPFSRHQFAKHFREQMGRRGYDLRRLARDQTNKLTGQLTQIRQESLGIRKFIWRTSGDNRVRETHQQFEGRTYLWSNPPEGGPGFPIQCRCTAQAVIDEAVLTHLAAGAE